MKDSSLQKNLSDTQIFQKYPKNYQLNPHYKSVKQKLFTFQDQQEIIKFPLTTNTSHLKSYNQFSPNSTHRKIEKYKGKRYQTIPMKTINYTTPINHSKNQQFQNTIKSFRKLQEQNKFNSKNLFTNMKKLKDLRKNNYKNRIPHRQKCTNQQILKQSDQNKLDLFRLTSTNFNYKQKTKYDCPTDIQFLRKINKTQGIKRNVIKFKNSADQRQKTEQKDQNQQQTEEKDKQNDIFFVLQPAKTQNMTQRLAHKQKQKKIRYNKSTKFFNEFRRQEGTLNLMRTIQNQNQQNIKNFVRYSETQIGLESPIIRKGIRRLSQYNKNSNNNHYQRFDSDHITSPFKGSFRIKHIDDNKNILITTIKKKANLLNKEQLVDFIKHVVK